MVKKVLKGSASAFISVLLVISMSRPVMAKVKVKIRRPRRHTTLSDYKFRVKGRILKAPEGMSFWICLQEKGNKQWKPQGGPIKLDDVYFESLAYIVFDGIDDRGKPTKINVAIVGVNSAGNDVLKKYIEKAFKEDKYPYVDLPAGSKVLKIRKIKYESE